MPRINPDKQREYVRRHYERNKDYYKSKARTRQAEIHEWFVRHKATCVCARCPESHVACLDFHHRNPEEKEFDVAKGVNNGCSIERLTHEIAKCDVLCANCHRKEHWKRRQEEDAISLECGGGTVLYESTSQSSTLCGDTHGQNR